MTLNNDPTAVGARAADDETLFLLRVKRGHARIPDPITHQPVWEALHYVEFCIGEEAMVSLTDLRHQIAELVGDGLPFADRFLLAESLVKQVVAHPRTPYGVAVELRDGPPQTIVFFRSTTYRLNASGGLTRLTGRGHHGLWPRRDAWRIAQFRTRRWALQNGLLR